MIIILHDSYYISPQLFELLPHKYPIYATSITDPNFLFLCKCTKCTKTLRPFGSFGYEWALWIQIVRVGEWKLKIKGLLVRLFNQAKASNCAVFKDNK